MSNLPLLNSTRELLAAAPETSAALALPRLAVAVDGVHSAASVGQLAFWDGNRVSTGAELPNAATMAEVIPIATHQPRAGRTQQTEHVQVRARWIGVVTAVSDQTFHADITDQDDATAVRETAELTRAALSQDDYALLAIGAVFYWTVGYAKNASGTCRTFSEIRFRRLPVWTPADLRKLDEPSDIDDFFR